MQSQCSGAVITLPILPISLLATSVDVCRTQCAGVSDVIRTCELREKDTARYFLFCSSPKGFHFHVQRRELPRPSVCASLALLQQTPPGSLGPTGRDATVCITGLVIHSLVREEKQLRNYQGTHISDYPAPNAEHQHKRKLLEFTLHTSKQTKGLSHRPAPCSSASLTAANCRARLS